MGAIPLTEQAMEWIFSWALPFTRWRPTGRRRHSAVPGLLGVGPLSQPQRLEGEVRSCGWLAQRGRSTVPADGTGVRHPSLTILSPVSRSKAAALRQASLDHAALQPGPAERGRDCRPSAVLTASR
jgi:hypothetical protein